MVIKCCSLPGQSVPLSKPHLGHTMRDEGTLITVLREGSRKVQLEWGWAEEQRCPAKQPEQGAHRGRVQDLPWASGGHGYWGGATGGVHEQSGPGRLGGQRNTCPRKQGNSYCQEQPGLQEPLSHGNSSAELLAKPPGF